MIWKFAPLVLAMAASLVTGLFLLGEFNFIVFISICLAGLAETKLSLSNSMPMGHGVSGQRHILGMPTHLFVIYLILLGMILFIASINEASLLPITNANFRVFGLSFFYGWIGGLADWYLWSANTTYYPSEYFIRRDLKARGLTEEEVEHGVDSLRSKGILPPK